MRQEQIIQLGFPIKGIDVSYPKIAQPPDTCVDAQNVRSDDLIEQRIRGGSRPGLSKYVANAAVAATRIQDVNHVTSVLNTAPIATSLSVRQITPVAVCNGSVFTFNTASFTLATGGAALSNTAPFILSAELFGKLYFADGVNNKVFTASNATVNTWTPTAGALPTGGASIYPRLIEVWRSRIVLSGLRTDPHNWFMSKLGDPLDWDYAPTAVTEIQAVQGGVGYVGKLGDVINCIIPYSDDLLLFGCDKSLWQLSGDPMAGGRRDLVSDSVGMAFGRPWCKDPGGTVYFFSTQGRLYSLSLGGLPVEVSGPVGSLIENTNLNTNVVRMEYDEESSGIHLFITPLTAGSATHWFIDARNGAWTKVVLANTNYNPVCSHKFDGDAPGDRIILFGGEDGFLRYFNKSVFTDDGTNFTNYVVIGPIMTENGRYPFLLREIQAVLDESSGSVLYEILSGDTPDAALASAAGSFVGEGSLSVGRSFAYQPRERSYYTYIKLGSTSNTKWAMEEVHTKISAIVSSKGRSL